MAEICVVNKGEIQITVWGMFTTPTEGRVNWGRGRVKTLDYYCRAWGLLFLAK